VANISKDVFLCHLHFFWVQNINIYIFTLFFAKIRKICIVGIGKTSMGNNNSGSVEELALMIALEFSAMADGMVWPLSLLRDRK